MNLSRKTPNIISQLSAHPCCYLRKVRLILAWAGNEQEFSRSIKKVLRKFFSKAKRVSSIEIEIENEKGYKTSILKYLAFLRSLKDMRIRCISSKKMTFKALDDVLFSIRGQKTFRHLEHAYLKLELNPEHIQDKGDLENHLTDLSEALDQYKQSPMINMIHFKIRLPFFVVPEPMITNKFIKCLEDLPNLDYLGNAFEPEAPWDLSTGIVQNIQDVKVLDFCLVGAHTELLPRIIQKALDMKPLQKLVIWLRRLHIEPVKIFFKELKGLKQIETLILNCENGFGLDDEALGMLGESLGNLTNLKRFELNFNATNVPIMITANGIDKLLGSLGRMRDLEELNIFLNNSFSGRLTHDLYQTLCSSLKMLNKLHSLALFFAGNRFGEEDLAIFEKYFKRSGSNLQNLVLNFQGQTYIEPERMSQFITLLGSLKMLKTLGLKLKCTELNGGLASALISALRSLKNLDSFNLNLLSERDQDVLLTLRTYNKLVRLGDRMSIKIERI